MTSLEVSGPFIRVPGFRKGRARKLFKKNKITFLVLHTAEGATDEKSLGRYFQTGNRNASSSAGIGQDVGYAQYVEYRDTPWTNTPVNDDSETLEICGFSRWNRREWMNHSKMLETVARWIAWRSQENDIPIRRVQGSAIRNGQKGICDHRDINRVFKKSSHGDVGDGFPWDYVLDKAYRIRNKSIQTLDETKLAPNSKYVVQRGDTYFTIAARTYGSGEGWTTIAQANGNRPLVAGTTITLPKFTETTPRSAEPILGPWPGYDLIRPGKKNNRVRQLQRKLRQVVGEAKAKELSPLGVTGYYGDGTRKLVKYALRNNPETWTAGKKAHDGKVGPLSWRTIAKM